MSSFLDLFLDAGKLTPLVWGSGGTVERQKSNSCVQQYMLNVTRNTCRSIRELEGEIVDLEALSASTENRGYMEIPKSKKMALIDLIGTEVQGVLLRLRV